MYEPPSTLLPQLAQWLASGDPALVAKANAALQAAEPDTNDLLLTQIKKGQETVLFSYFFCLALSQIPFQVATHCGSSLSIGRICFAFIVVVPCFWTMIRYVFLPTVRRHYAVMVALAQRGDIRAMPSLLQHWRPVVKQTGDQSDIEDALLTLLQTAAPGETPIWSDPKSKDPKVILRLKFDALTRKRKGLVCFAPAATTTPRRLQLWLTLLPHLAADSNPKSQAVLRRIADARAQTLQEELIQNDACILLTENAQPAAKSEAAPPQLQTPTWNPTAADETPAQIQRLRRP